MMIRWWWMHKVKDGEVHKVKDKVIREVAKVDKDMVRSRIQGQI